MKKQVNDNEGKNQAKNINAIYLRTSAELNSSIGELFNNIGNKYLNHEMEITKQFDKRRNYTKIGTITKR